MKRKHFPWFVEDPTRIDGAEEAWGDARRGIVDGWRYRDAT